MWESVRNWFSSKSYHIGIDIGTHTIRMAQVSQADGDFQLRTAASATIPDHLLSNIDARMSFFTKAVRDLLVQGKFKGRSAGIGLPSSWTNSCHLQMGNQSDAELSRSIPALAAEQMEISNSLVRHLVIGEGENRDVIVTAVKRETVNGLLQAVEQAGLIVQSIVLEPAAIVDCFSHVYRRKSDANSTTCFVDLGSTGTRMIVARGNRILHLRYIAIGGDELTAAVADAFGVEAEDARLLRQKTIHSRITRAETDLARIEDGTSDTFNGDAANIVEQRVEAAVQRSMSNLISELRVGRTMHEERFAGLPIERLVFCGAEARNRFVCQRIAQALGLPAQIGDPMVRMSRTSGPGLLGGIDRRQPQPDWSVALGLAMGPAKEQSELPDLVSYRPGRSHNRTRREAA